MSGLAITPSSTPNPNARKFTLNRPVGATMVNLTSAAEAVNHPLACELFALPGVTNVFLTADFVTVNKRSDVSWETLEPRILPILHAHFGGS